MMTSKRISPTAVKMISVGHVLLLTLSNLLVQYPFNVLGFHTTWGAFTYPAIFILTDLTTRFSGPESARQIIFRSMIPGLIISYLIASYMESGDMLAIHPMPLRIAFACFIAYVTGQLLDVLVFQRYRNKSSWWLAPSISAAAGNVMDTVLFFSIAFYHCSNPFLNQHWPEIACVDAVFKLAISLFAFVPVYGLLLNLFTWKSPAIRAQ